MYKGFKYTIRSFRYKSSAFLRNKYYLMLQNLYFMYQWDYFVP